MAPHTAQQRAQYVIWYAESRSDYHKFAEKVRRERGEDATVPDYRSVRGWKETLLETGNLEDKPKKRAR